MQLIDVPSAALTWLGRQGTRAVAASIFVGLALPPLAALFRPFVTEAIFLLLLLAFLRLDPTEMRLHWHHPGLVLAATAWTMLVLPALLGGLYAALGLPPDLTLPLVMQAAAPPLMSAPAFAALLGLDIALPLLVLVLSTMVTPVTTPAFVQMFSGASLTVSPVALGVRLFLLIAGAALMATLVRRLAGRPWIERQKEPIDGINVLVLFSFAVALMDGVGARILAEPLAVLGLVALAFALSLGNLAVTALVFARAGAARAFVLGLTASNRNMGIMLAASAGAVSDLTWLYFALAQFPIYLLPQLLKPLARRLLRSQPG